MTGEKFLRGLITPIDPKNIFFLLQSGYAADFILGLTVESLNGVRNRSTAGGAVREADPEFIRALDLLREVQAAGAFGMRVEEDKAKGSTGVVFFRRDDVPADIAEKGAEIRRLLKLPAEQQKFVLTYSPVRGAENELAVNSRSMLQIMQAFASYLDVPEAHLKDHSAVALPGKRPRGGEPPAERCGFTAARTSRRTRSPPCVTATTGSGLTTATGKPSARSRPSCSSSRWRKPAAREKLPLDHHPGAIGVRSQSNESPEPEGWTFPVSAGAADCAHGSLRGSRLRRASHCGAADGGGARRRRGRHDGRRRSDRQSCPETTHVPGAGCAATSPILPIEPVHAARVSVALRKDAALPGGFTNCEHGRPSAGQAAGLDRGGRSFRAHPGPHPLLGAWTNTRHRRGRTSILAAERLIEMPAP